MAKGSKGRVTKVDRKREIVCVAISDTHGQHRHIAVPDGDLLIHAGDFTMFSRSKAAVIDFNEWLGELPHKYKVVIPGNHDWKIRDPEWHNLITAAVLLRNQGTELGGLKIWGAMLAPSDGNPLGDGTEKDRRDTYSQIPVDIDLLITHSPPFGILDVNQNGGKPQGCRFVLDAVRHVKPQAHVFGHIHPPDFGALQQKSGIRAPIASSELKISSYRGWAVSCVCCELRIAQSRRQSADANIAGSVLLWWAKSELNSSDLQPGVFGSRCWFPKRAMDASDQCSLAQIFRVDSIQFIRASV